MSKTIEAVFDGKVLRPNEPLSYNQTPAFASQLISCLQILKSHNRSSALPARLTCKAHQTGLNE